MNSQLFNKLLNLLVILITCTLLLLLINQSFIISTDRQNEFRSIVCGTTNRTEDIYKPFIGVSIEELIKGPYILKQDTPQLIQYIQHNLSPPSKKPYHLGYDLRHPSKGEDPSDGQTKEIMNILGEMRNGFFVECGALDGEWISNTLMFEKKYGWNGVLVEANPSNYHNLMSKQRKAWAIHACLSREPYPMNVLFPVQDGCCGKISDRAVSSNRGGFTEVQCLPLFSILMALNTTTIDYFSLDIEGHELDVLKTIPWDRVNIKTISVEVNTVRGNAPMKETEKSIELVKYMKNIGYYIYKPINVLQRDIIFYKKDILPKIRSV